MVSFIIYDDDIHRRESYVKIIKRFLYTLRDKYKIYEYEKLDGNAQDELKRIEGARIYLINSDVENQSGLKLARGLRENEDFISPIIFLTAREKSELMDEIKNILFLDIIKIDDNIVQNLLSSLREAHRIVTRNSVYTFSSFDEVYRIPYNDIYYIAKNLNDDSVTIYTKDDTYLNYITIKKIEGVLKGDPRFFKSHRSCIVNLYNVSSYDKKSNVIIFNNGMKINLVSRQNKSLLSEKLKEFSNV